MLTLQNGVDSVDEVAAAVGEARVLGGTTYVATAIAAPGIIEQTGTHRRVLVGEAFGDRARRSPSASRASRQLLTAADVQAEAFADGRVPIWEKLIYLSPFAAFTGAARRPAGFIWNDPVIREAFLAAVDEVERVARAEGIAVAPDVAPAHRRLHARAAAVDALVAADRSAAGQAHRGRSAAGRGDPPRPGPRRPHPDHAHALRRAARRQPAGVVSAPRASGYGCRLRPASPLPPLSRCGTSAVHPDGVTAG